MDVEVAGMDEWLIRTVMTLYTEACTVVRTDAGLTESEGWFASRVSTVSTVVCEKWPAFRVALC